MIGRILRTLNTRTRRFEGVLIMDPSGAGAAFTQSANMPTGVFEENFDGDYISD